ncbi:AMP-binding protein [Roseovarius sp. SK2]|uniref:class I adenylate-forming enzyme family protein n=1 Tax=Roseovarius TaxID=74030 RepID=UPI00237A6BA1|nr:AMP-binding protein [Roseovarius sp. SK2]MDD9724628.1 AMP-binding protein [Roseovarius sp. SK2]
MALVTLAQHAGPPYFDEEETVASLLETAARDNPDHVYLSWDDGQLTYAGLDAAAGEMAGRLAGAGIKSGDRVGVMLSHHPDHVITFFALAKMGAVLVPINVALRGKSLSYQLSHSQAALLIADRMYEEALAEAEAPRVLWRDGAGEFVFSDGATYGAKIADFTGAARHWSDLRIILYTSGTTGMPKGVQMSDRMVQASALSSAWLSDVQQSDVLHFWDPIYHVFGTEVLVMALMVPVRLHMVPRFSASRFWHEVKECGATHVHFVGGMLQLLLKQPEAEIDKTHGARIAWGGGCPVEVWEDFARRYAVEIREGYGMTETSSFSTINIGGPVGSVGKAADFFDVEVMAEDGTPCVDGETGEICVREREPGVLTVGYYNNDAATAEARRGDWFPTGDFGVRNADGYISFKGRKKHSIRRRGENISSAQVEMAINDHPQVSETAVIGVKDDMGDEELKVYVLPADPADLDIPAIAEWCKGQMAAFQVPRFWAVVDSFPKTPTQRIQKHLLPQTQEAGDFDTACTKNTERS